jgi:hypothetical protein
VLALAMTMHKPSGPRYRRASERSHNAASMRLFLGTRVRRVVGDMVAKSGQVYKPLEFAALLSPGDRFQFPDHS